MDLPLGQKQLVSAKLQVVRWRVRSPPQTWLKGKQLERRRVWPFFPWAEIAFWYVLLSHGQMLVHKMWGQSDPPAPPPPPPQQGVLFP